MIKKYLPYLILTLSLGVQAEETPTAKTFRVLEGNYTVCKTQALYQQLVSWSLYGVGQPPQTGCLPAPAHAKAIIKQCPDNDIIICEFKLIPEDGGPAMDVWASKVMLRPDNSAK